MIKYVNGDATAPQGDGKKVIVHCCNDLGAWGAGFVMALSRRWKAPEQMYRRFIENLDSDGSEKLGKVQFVAVEPDICVANMIGQHLTGRGEMVEGKLVPPIRYEAIREGLKQVNMYCRMNNATMHAPKFGSDLAGGDWNVIEQIIKDEIEVPVTIYIFK